VGIPRGLLFYLYYPLWRAFFNALHVAVVVSAETNRAILDDGLHWALDEACLPVKLYFGHALSLADRVDYLFVPRMVSVEPREYICPKLMGLPDMLRARLPGLPEIIDPVIDFSKMRSPGELGRDHAGWLAVLEGIGRIFTDDQKLIRDAARTALEAERLFRARMSSGLLPAEAMEAEAMDDEAASAGELEQRTKPDFTIGLLGHGYNLYDSYISMNLINRLRQMGAAVVTADALPAELIAEKAAQLPKRLFWTLCKQMMGAACHFFDEETCDGVIYLTSFGCGPESLVGELIALMAKHRSRIPYMLLTIDEHTGATGMVTRLEAFTDMLQRRRQ
jgi:predicted nucleotide-binding protein (sugar kinase/HSP70/actin superfamily)